MKGKRPKKKIVLFLVEGASDRMVLEEAISALYDRIDEEIIVYFPTIEKDEQLGGDITSEFGVHTGTIEDRIYDEYLRGFFDREKILPKDIHEIIHIVDTDGVYIPDASVEVGENPDGSRRYYYQDDRIIVPDYANACYRNRRKRNNLDYLVSKSRIKVRQKSVRYSVYYFSCNLDHYIHQDPNLDYQLKFSLARTFSANYSEDVDGFVRLICQDDYAVSGLGYEESWDYIRQGHNSLHCHTNLNILIERLLAETAGA